MARTTHVKAAQQRYKMVPVLGEDGKPVRTPVIGRNGEQKTSKRGAQFRTQTVADRSQPLPLETCDACHEPIAIGTPYKWIAPKSGPYGGRRLTRHAGCPTWQVWEYSSSLSARVAQVQHEGSTALDALGDEFESVDDVRGVLEDVAQQARDLAEEKREGASNIVDGFGHETESSAALEEVADALDSWADDLEGTDLDEAPEVDTETETDCDTCDASGKVDEDGTEVDCSDCDGTGQVENEDATNEMEEWRESVIDAARSAIDEGPSC